LASAGPQANNGLRSLNVSFPIATYADSDYRLAQSGNRTDS